MGQEGVQEGGEKGWLEAVYGLPDTVRDVVGTGGGGIQGLRKGPGYFLRGDGGIVLTAYEAEGQGRWGFGREMVEKGRLCYLGWAGGPRPIQEPLRRAAKRKPFGLPEVVGSSR